MDGIQGRRPLRDPYVSWRNGRRGIRSMGLGTPCNGRCFPDVAQAGKDVRIPDAESADVW